MLLRLAIMALVSPGLLSGGAAARTLEGPVAAWVERVIDGDTIRVRAQVWLDQELSVNVRLRGVDAPEMRAQCAAELAEAEAARDHLIGMLGTGMVRLHAISGGKYHGRVIADVTIEDGRDLAQALLEAGVARPYDGGRREGWCEAAE